MGERRAAARCSSACVRLARTRVLMALVVGMAGTHGLPLRRQWLQLSHRNVALFCARERAGPRVWARQEKRGPKCAVGAPLALVRPGRKREGEPRTLVQDGIGRLSSEHTVRRRARHIPHLARMVVWLSPLAHDVVLPTNSSSTPAPHRRPPLVPRRRNSTDNVVLNGENVEFLLVCICAARASPMSHKNGGPATAPGPSRDASGGNGRRAGCRGGA